MPLLIIHKQEVCMKKRLTAGILAATYLSITTVTPVMADVDQQTIVDESSKTINDNVDSDEPYGVLVNATKSGTGEMNVHVNGDVTVYVEETEGGDKYVIGVGVNNSRKDNTSNVNVTVDGDIDLDNEVDDIFPTKGAALKTDNNSDSALNVTTGSITSYSEIPGNETSGINNTATSGTTNITVNGDVNASYGGSANDPGPDTTLSVGLISETQNKSENGSASTAITIHGDLTANSEKAIAEGGYISSTGANASTELSVTGSIIASSDEFGANGLEVGSVNGVVRADIGKNITATGDLGANGILTYLEGRNSLTEINVEGSITATGTDASAILINQLENAEKCSDSESVVSIRAGGDVTSSAVGIVDLDQLNGGQTNVLIEGKLVSEGPAVVVVKEAAENLNLTVWKIETQNEHIAMEDHTNANAEYSDIAKKVEQSIQYILKVEEKQGNLISLDQAKTQSWTSLDGTTSTYHVGHENERVAVKLNIPKGSKVDKAYSDKDKKTDLLRDDNGNYYLIVPRGGGVLISVSLVPDDSENGSNENNGNNSHEDTGSDGDNNYGGNPPATDEPQTTAVQTRTDVTAAPEVTAVAADANGTATITLENVSVSEGIASVTFSENLSAASITAESLNSILSSGASELKIRTAAGEFHISSADLTNLTATYTSLRFVLNGTQLEVYADDAAVPVMAIALAA